MIETKKKKSFKSIYLIRAWIFYKFKDFNVILFIFLKIMFIAVFNRSPKKKSNQINECILFLSYILKLKHINFNLNFQRDALVFNLNNYILIIYIFQFGIFFSIFLSYFLINSYMKKISN
jgi:hypothetical protein